MILGLRNLGSNVPAWRGFSFAMVMEPLVSASFYDVTLFGDRIFGAFAKTRPIYFDLRGPKCAQSGNFNETGSLHFLKWTDINLE